MKKAFSSISGASVEPGSAPLLQDERLPRLPLAPIEEAVRRARAAGQATLLSLSIPFVACDPLDVFGVGPLPGSRTRFFWEHGREQPTLVGLGAAAWIESKGLLRFARASAAWERLRKQTLISEAAEGLAGSGGPLLFGGFAFDPLRPRTPLWKSFPDGLLIVPSLLFACDAHRTTLTLNRLVTAESDPQEIASELTMLLERLRVALQEAARRNQAAAAEPAERLSVEALPAPAVWQAQVARAVEEIRRGRYQKVVLARALRLRRPAGAFQIERILQRLRAGYPEAYIFAFQQAMHCFVGASPERLVRASDGALYTMALAGSAPRGSTPAEDQRLADALLSSAKDHQEHQIVVQTIYESLRRLCANVSVAAEPHLRRLKNIQHLETHIAGRLLEGRSVLEALQELHPTPAVGGFPRAAALQAIRASEQLDRGWYAAPIGWVDGAGNGEFAVALRSALIHGDEATVFAGGGIMADSDPAAEYNETCWKFRAMCGALGLDDEHEYLA
jgi:isochorismate synthase